MATWQEFTSIPNGTRIFNHGFDQCVALANHYHEEVLGGRFVGVNSAHEWWTRFGAYPQLAEKYYQSQESVPGAIFVSRGGIYDAVHGHIGVVTADGPTTIDTMEQNAGTWRYTGRYTRGMANIYGFLIPHNNPANQQLTPTQRQVGANPANRRSAASTTSLITGDPLAPGVVGEFNGWMYGDQVNDGVANTNIWYRGAISGDWFWAGAFTSISTIGLTDLNPAKPPAVGSNQRQVDPIPVNVRKTPSSAAEKTGELAANSVVTPEGWVTGQSVQGIAIWYKVAGGYAWAGGFTKEDTSGLNDLNTGGTVDPPAPTDPTGPTNDLGYPGSVLATIERWSESAPNFDVSLPRPIPASVNLPLPDGVEEVIKRPNGNFNIGREAAPNHHVVHHGAQPNMDGLVNTLMGPGAPSASFVVGDKKLVSMVDTADTPATNGRWRSNLYSCTYELKNDKTTTDKPSAETHELTAWAIARETLKWGMKTPLKVDETVLGHKTVSKSQTACPGLVDLEWITNRANEIIEAYNSNQEVPPPNYSDLAEAVTGLTKVINQLIDLLKSIFRVGQ